MGRSAGKNWCGNVPDTQSSNDVSSGKNWCGHVPDTQSSSDVSSVFCYTIVPTFDI